MILTTASFGVWASASSNCTESKEGIRVLISCSCPGVLCTVLPLVLLAHRQDRITSVTPFSNQHEVALVSIVDNQSDTTLGRATNSNNNNNNFKNNQTRMSKLQDKLTLADRQSTTKKYKEYVQPSSMIHSQLGHFHVR